jgi:hypothetical protein
LVAICVLVELDGVGRLRHGGEALFQAPLTSIAVGASKRAPTWAR